MKALLEERNPGIIHQPTNLMGYRRKKVHKRYVENIVMSLFLSISGLILSLLFFSVFKLMVSLDLHLQ